MKTIAFALALCGLLAACGDDGMPTEHGLIPCPCNPGQADQFLVPQKSDHEHAECTHLPPGATAADVGEWSPIIAQCAWPRL